MTGKDLVAHLRESILDDIYLPQLWSDSELLRLLNLAEAQACRRAQLIVDSSTEEDNDELPLCTLSIAAGTATYSLSPKILQIRRCQLRSMSYPLRGPVQADELDDVAYGWMGTGGTVVSAGTGGSPSMFMNEPNNRITIVLAPASDDTADLVVVRLPLSDITLSTSPEIEDQYHLGLCNWAAHLAYMKPDSETINLNLAKMHEDLFIREFGPLPDAQMEKMRKTITPRQRMRARTFGS